MVQYNCNANGNPTTYRGKTLTWTRGRLLETCPSLTSPNVTWTFTYNADGIRVEKSAPGVTTTYGVDGERIVYEKTNGQVKRYFYDESGVAGFEYNGQKYIFRKNLQGDVTGIYNAAGTLIGEYEYDAWGNLLNDPESEVLLANPFRYRGYYYDTSIGLYYLNSRYYDPEVGRFLNEDLVSCLDPETIGGINLYAYCLNDPVNNIDPSGTVALLTGLLIAVGIGAAVGAVSYTVSEVISYAATGVWTWSWGMFLGSTIGGAAGGALSFFAPNMIPFFSGAISGFSASVVGMCLENALGEANHTGWEIFKSSLVAAEVSALAAGITSKIKIRGVTSGRGSFQQVYKQINTKFLHGTIHSIKLKTFGKMFAYVGMTELLNTISSAGQDILSWYEYLKEHPLYGNL